MMKTQAILLAALLISTQGYSDKLFILDASTPSKTPINLIALDTLKSTSEKEISNLRKLHPEINFSLICNSEITDAQPVCVKNGYNLNTEQQNAVAFIGTLISAKRIQTDSDQSKVDISITEYSLREINKTESLIAPPALSPHINIEGIRSEAKIHKDKPTIIGPKHFKCDMRNHAYIIQIVEHPTTGS